MSEFRLHSEAFGDLDEIRGYVAIDNPDTANFVISEIFIAIRKLIPFPHQGHRRPDLTSRPLRFITVYDYLICYAPEQHPLLIVAVLHGRRNPLILSKILAERE